MFIDVVRGAAVGTVVAHVIVRVPPRCPRQRPLRCGGNNVGIVIN